MKHFVVYICFDTLDAVTGEFKNDVERTFEIEAENSKNAIRFAKDMLLEEVCQYAVAFKINKTIAIKIDETSILGVVDPMEAL